MFITALIVVGLIYLAFHAGHSHAKWRSNRHQPWLRRIWISVPGPFGTRISKRV